MEHILISIYLKIQSHQVHFQNSNKAEQFLAEGEGLGKLMSLTFRDLHGWCILAFLKSKQISKMKP